MISEPTRLFDFAFFQLENYPREDALVTKVNGKWVKTSTKLFVEKGTELSLGLQKLGIKPGDKIAIISHNNRTEWNICDLGISQTGAISVPVYPTISSADYEYIFNDAEVVYCFVSNQELFDKVNAVKDKIPSLKNIFGFEKIDGCESYESIFHKGTEEELNNLETIKSGIKEEDLATLIYTSGTTGSPKGVMLSHKNIASNAKASRSRLPVQKDAIGLSFLPLCHIYERMLLYLYAYSGMAIYYAESMETIGDNIREVKPDVFTAVPRLLEKVYDKIIAKGTELSGIKKALFFWAVNLGHEYDVMGKSGWYHFKLKIARKLIFSKWQEALGGNVKAIASGSAALNPNLARVFLAADINIQEGYGLTETSPVIAVNCPIGNNTRIGTVGKVIDDVEVKIAEDGEILVKGPNVMMGYYNKPDMTKEVLTEDGWFHTGDIGEFQEGGFLKITDRKKEIFKTSGGKYIAPQIMENTFKESHFIENIMVIGEGEKHPAAFIQPEFEFLKSWCARKDIPYTSNEEMIKMERIIKRIQKEVDHYNQQFGKWEQVKLFELTPEVWSIDAGHLTPTLKLKRKNIRKIFSKEYENIYGHPPMK